MKREARAAATDFSGVGYEEAMRRARELIPFFRGRSEECEKARRLTPPVMDALNRSGLIRYLQPRAWGGMEPNEFGHAWVRFGHRVFERLATLRMPLIAAVNGHALGGGLELAAAADIRIAESQVKIGLPEAGLGMVPGWSGTQRLVRRFGAQAVRRMLLGGEVLTAGEAAALGIVDQVVETGTSVAAAKAYAARIAARGPAATEVSKLMIAVANGEDNGSAVEALGSILVAKTGDLKEGVAAFTGKRPADFKGEW